MFQIFILTPIDLSQKSNYSTFLSPYVCFLFFPSFKRDLFLCSHFPEALVHKGFIFLIPYLSLQPKQSAFTSLPPFIPLFFLLLTSVLLLSSSLRRDRGHGCVCANVLAIGSWVIVLVSVTGDNECMKGLYEYQAACVGAGNELWWS